ncbi:glycosyltransferase [Novosphingobium sp. 1949]|uniref:Glycosyltransferase n=1 Tax=Novosphingobium organovorum TaxID=2930092 RepID=A0ABT0BE15_9SPHN|nr:glycosyltransferase [Novosphingobium organovorum]MCJ2183289.1 glycosyltransferase [Novosphingobium organovorum]
MRGGERVLERLLHLFPDADIFTHVYDPERMSEKIRSARVQETFIGRLPGARKHYQKYLPLMPMALEELDLRDYDLVISSESGPAKGIITRNDALHVCYCHSPMRYLWDHYHDYKSAAGGLARFMMPAMFHRLRQWDVSSASRVDAILANSRFIERRIHKVWGRQARVVHPPVAVDEFSPSDAVGGRYLWVSQMTPYKRADIALEAFNRMGVPALMVGDGEMYAQIARSAGPNVEVRKRLTFAQLKHAYATCKALVFTPEEDFGIVPVEANASGRPVIAYGHGGVTDSIVDGATGLFFEEQSIDALCEAIYRFERWLPQFDPAEAVANAARFAPEVFDRGVMGALDALRQIQPCRA